jgi:hypothetical protein
MEFRNRLALLSLMGVISVALCGAEEARKPACNKKNQGQFWPAEANVRGDAVLQRFQEGNLEMCSLAVWKYRWERVSVNVRDLARAKRTAVSNAAERLPAAASSSTSRTEDTSASPR